MMHFYLLAVVTLLLAWAFSFPQQTRAIIAELKRQLRLWIIHHGGERTMQAVAKELYQRAVKAGHDPDLVKEILDENWDIIRDRLGRPVADDILGEPSTLEPYG